MESLSIPPLTSSGSTASLDHLYAGAGIFPRFGGQVDVLRGLAQGRMRAILSTQGPAHVSYP